MLYRALFAFIALPGIFAGLFPVMITIYDPYRISGYHTGLAFFILGLTLLIWCVRDFLVAGHGTLAPWDPPKNLVIIGLYRYSRNPMYVAIIILLSGWVLSTGSPLLAMYGCALASLFYLRVVFGEERILAEQFGEQWTDYEKKVARWLPLPPI
jgi:protein-S-isoprenylcysteine O-methyltransferase Ste14